MSFTTACQVIAAKINVQALQVVDNHLTHFDPYLGGQAQLPAKLTSKLRLSVSLNLDKE